MYAFCGAFEMEAPTKAALQNLLVYTYHKFGWNTGEIATGQRKYPVIKDLINYLPQFCNDELVYGNEVSSNIQGSLLNRLKTLSEGTVGSIVDCESGISAEKLCNEKALIELDELPISIKPFIANLLVVKINEYLRQRDANGALKNTIVLEEAHNVFGETSNNSVKTSKDIASEYFSNLLSEIRAYGTSLIIVDQSPSDINSNAIANTSIKITHALSTKDDADTISYAYGFTEYQKQQLTNLGTGVVLITKRGDRKSCKAQVSKVNLGIIINIACMFCNLSSCCDKSMNWRINIDESTMNMFATRIYNVRYDGDTLRREVNNITSSLHLSYDNSFCLLGYILTASKSSYSEREKRRILYILK